MNKISDKTLDNIMFEYLNSDGSVAPENREIKNNSLLSLENINTMTGHEFESLVCILISKMGFTAELTRETADGGVDIIACRNEPILSGKYIIQCKRKNSPISESVVRDLYGVVTAERANKGILITNSKFSSSSEKFAADKQIELIDGEKLTDLLVNYLKTGFEKKEIKIPYYLEALFRSVMKEGNAYENRYREIKRGLIYGKYKTIRDKKGYYNFIESKLGDIEQFLSVTVNWTRDSLEKPSEATQNTNAFIKPKVNSFRTLIKGFLDSWKGAYFTKPPLELFALHNRLLDLYDLLILNVIIWLNTVSLFLDDPKIFLDDNNRVNIPTIYDKDSNKKFNDIIDEIATMIRNDFLTS